MQSKKTYKNLVIYGFFAKNSLIPLTDSSFTKQKNDRKLWNMGFNSKLLIFTALALISINTKAESFGIGAVIGDPTGVSTKMWLDKTHAIDGAFAWSFSGPNALHVQSDYLIHELSFFHVRKLPLNLYYGIGGRLSSYSSKNKSGLGIGARAPIGVSYNFQNPSVEFFGEAAAILELTPKTDVFFKSWHWR